MTKLAGYRTWWQTATKKQIEDRNKKISEAAGRRKAEGRKTKSWWDTATPEMVEKRNKKLAESQKRRNRENPELVARRNEGNRVTHSKRSKVEKEEVSKKISGTLKAWYKNHPEERARLSRTTTEWYASLSDERKAEIGSKILAHNIVSPNKPELMLSELIKPLGFKFVGNGKFWIGHRNPDFVNAKKRVVVELFGRYWHQDQDKDLKRIRAYKEAGYKVVIVWDDNLYKDPDRQVVRIKSKLQET